MIAEALSKDYKATHLRRYPPLFEITYIVSNVFARNKFISRTEKNEELRRGSRGKGVGGWEGRRE